ncbi:MAG: serine/threonine protein kinase [Lentisphaeraceae bacterium]|nr:serine/threonine protein kinase [Lentisphaeraceae bacterium]
MKNDQDSLVNISQDDMDYRSLDLYDLGEDIRNKECLNHYKKYEFPGGRYSELTKIASGGMKTIYRAFDNKTNRDVAFASLNKDLPPEYVSAFINEARLTASLQHPNIIRIHEIGFDEKDQPFFTMELKPGDSLQQILKQLKVNKPSYKSEYSLRDLITIFLKVCDAVSYSHSCDILHLDIKPENIQVGDFGEVLLCDWGLSRYVGEKESKEVLLDQEFLLNKTLHAEIKGTPGYMAPEQISKQTERGFATDIYSLGALLYTILTLERPSDGELENILEKTLNGEVLPPVKRCPDRDIPDSLNAVVIKAMKTDISERYVSVRELAADVQKHMEGYSTSAENAGLLKELALFYNRNKSLVLVSLVFILCLVTGVLLFVISLNSSIKRETELRHLAESSANEAQENLSMYFKEKELADLSLSHSPDGVVQDLERKYREYIHIDTKHHVDEIYSSLLRVTEANKSNPFLYQFKAMLHFVRQEFDLCYEELHKGVGVETHANHTYLDIALVKMGDFKSDGKPAPVDLVVNLIKDIDGHMILNLGRFLLYDADFRQNKQEHFQIAKAIMCSKSDSWGESEVTYDEKTASLSLNGPFRFYTISLPKAKTHVPVFGALNLKHMKINSTKNILARALTGYKLDSLDLRGMKFVFDAQKIYPETTKKIYLTRDLVHKDMVSYFEEHFEVEWE